MSKQSNLAAAKKAKNDEFYTQLSDIEKELIHYKHAFKDKVVYCNCDDARCSNFFKYFTLNFEFLGLKKLITTSYVEEGHGTKYVYEGNKDGNPEVSDGELEMIELKSNGDFRSSDCIQLLHEVDIVVTNPPFSLFREYLAQLIQFNKQFIILGNKNALKYKEVFPLIKENKIWLGYTSPKDFIQPDKSIKKQMSGLTRWFTNIPIKKREEFLDLCDYYKPEKYPKYDNYDAIEVSKVKEIPVDYNGVMGVPITFLDSYCPKQFEILGELNNGGDNEYDLGKPILNGIQKYARILIRKKQESI